jgi:hypothetical protein
MFNAPSILTSMRLKVHRIRSSELCRLLSTEQTNLQTQYASSMTKIAYLPQTYPEKGSLNFWMVGLDYRTASFR